MKSSAPRFIGAFKDDQVTADDGTIIQSTCLRYNSSVLLQPAGVGEITALLSRSKEHGKAWLRSLRKSHNVMKGNVTFYGWEPMWGQDNMIDAAFSNGAKIISDDGKKF
ncbi:hypothetical protein OK016_29925 [Vibrio chagasii]|nr:hypothetical protein [Vibrio chagasii]